MILLWTAVCSLIILSSVPISYAATARLLIFSATAQFRHDSIPTAIEVLRIKGSSIGVEFDATEDASKFTDDNLRKYDAIVFLSTTGDVLPNDDSLQTYLNAGGNFVAIHSASDTLRNSKVYADELGSLFYNHADLQEFTVEVVDSAHPSVSKLPSRWTIRDEAYNFVSDPRSLGATVVLAADESTYTDRNRSTTQGTPHPIAWYQEKGAGTQSGGIAGRSFYTSLGHLNETWQDELFQGHILGGIAWVLQSNTTKAFNASGTVGNGGSTSGSASSSSDSTHTASAQGSTQTGNPSSGCKDAVSAILLASVLFFVIART